jgi:hypothetical protein
LLLALAHLGYAFSKVASIATIANKALANLCSVTQTGALLKTP